MLFVDFATGSLLQVTGTVRIDWDSATVRRTPGARRLLHVEIEEVVALPETLPIRWVTSGSAVRELRLVDKQPESADVTSFYFAARDDGPLPAFAAGQHLPLEVEIPERGEMAFRTYSLSGNPAAPHYRISVKREPHGLVSRFLHDQLEPGAFLTASAPQGDFTIEPATDRPVVLVGGGVGVTPLVSMLHALAREGDRPVWFVTGTRDGAHHPLRDEIAGIADRAAHVHVHVAYSRARPDDAPGRDYDSAGRVDGELLEKLVPGLDADFYLCGPVNFMAAIHADLETRGVLARRIHAESFGPQHTPETSGSGVAESTGP